MRKDHVVFDFIWFSIPQKIEIGRNVVINMSDNPKFISPEISLDRLEAKTELLQVRNMIARKGGKGEKALLHQTEAEWDDMMHKMAKYVNRVANGDSAIILNAGFDIQPISADQSIFNAEFAEKSASVLIHGRESK